MISRVRALRITATASALALAGGALTTAAASAEEPAAPKTRVTFMCKAPFEGVYKTSGESYEAGDYIFRIREEAGVPVSYTAGKGGSGLFSGSLAAGEVQYPATASPVAGVSVKTDPGPNTYTGTASTNENTCSTDEFVKAPEPKTRVTFMCKMPGTGTWNGNGAVYTAGDYIFRIREEAGVPVSYTAGVGGAGLFSGSLGAYQVHYPATSSPVAGVSVKTDPGPNTHKGTASTNESQACDYVPSAPVKKDDCKDGGWEAFGFRNQGECVASIVANENADK